MEKALSFAIAILALGMTTITLATGQKHGPDQETRDRFLGAWRLAWLEEPDTSGKVQRVDCTGLLVYTLDGHMSVQVMYRSAEPRNSSASVHYVQGGYEASFGRYEIDDARTFTFHVEGALVRSLVGKDLKRVYEFSGKQLVVKSPNPNEHWRVAWEHL